MSDLLAMQRAVWRAKRSTTEKIVLLAILDHYSDSSPEPWPSVARLAEHCGLGRTAVLDALASLESASVLVVRRVAGCPRARRSSTCCSTPRTASCHHKSSRTSCFRGSARLGCRAGWVRIGGRPLSPTRIK